MGKEEPIYSKWEKNEKKEIQPGKSFTELIGSHALKNTLKSIELPKTNLNQETTVNILLNEDNIQKLQEAPLSKLYNNDHKNFIPLKAYLESPQQTEKATIYQNDIIQSTPTEDPTIIDYSVAYKRLNAEINQPWKLNPGDIADFYLLEQYISLHDNPNGYNEDPTYLAVAKAKARVHEIGQRVLVATAYEQLEEYDRFAQLKPDEIPEDLQEPLITHYEEHADLPEGERDVYSDESRIRQLNMYLADTHAMLETHTKAGTTPELFTDPNNALMLTNAIRILESQQSGPWKAMATTMKALVDTSTPISSVIPDIEADEEIPAEVKKVLQRNREQFLIDRLLNAVHNKGTIAARITNYFPKAAAVMLAHGLPGHEDYLLYNSNIVYGTDSLAKQIKQSVHQEPSDDEAEEKRDLIEDFREATYSHTMPREYKYGLLLEFDNDRIHEAVQESQKHTITPTQAYTFLKQVSQHDGQSKGRLQQAA